MMMYKKYDNEIKSVMQYFLLNILKSFCFEKKIKLFFDCSDFNRNLYTI